MKLSLVLGQHVSGFNLVPTNVTIPNKMTRIVD